eukprot:3608321-Prymnesium_polylepis.1
MTSSLPPAPQRSSIIRAATHQSRMHLAACLDSADPAGRSMTMAPCAHEMACVVSMQRARPENNAPVAIPLHPPR